MMHIDMFGFKFYFQPPYENAADVGCGTGISTKVMAPHFKHVLGLDYSATQIAEAQSSIKEPNLSFRYYFIELTLCLPHMSPLS